MSQRTRIGIAVALILALVAVVLLVELVRHRQVANELTPGSIPIYINDRLLGSFLPTDLEQLSKASFIDAEEGKTQEGWRLRDVLLLQLTPDNLLDATITVSSSSRDKRVSLSWAQVSDDEAMVMFDLSGRGTLKLVSKLEGFDTRDAWIQDVDRIDIDL